MVFDEIVDAYHLVAEDTDLINDYLARDLTLDDLDLLEYKTNALLSYQADHPIATFIAATGYLVTHPVKVLNVLSYAAKLDYQEKDFE